LANIAVDSYTVYGGSPSGYIHKIIYVLTNVAVAIA